MLNVNKQTIVEIFYTQKENLKNRFVFYFFKFVTKFFSYNSYGMVSGWWQDWRFDHQAWDFLNKIYPTKLCWVTKSHRGSDYQKQLCNTKNLIWETSSPKITINEKGKREATMRVTLYQNRKVVSFADFVFIEEKNNYCKL